MDKEDTKNEIKKIITNQKNSKVKKNKKTSTKVIENQKVAVNQKLEDHTDKPPVIGMPLPFIINIYNTLLTANRRAHWEPSELMPVGRTIGELERVIKMYSPPSTSKPPTPS